MGEIVVYQHGANKEGVSKPLKVLASYFPGSGRLTYYYWDDWMLSGLLFPGGNTLTLGVAGASGPRQLAQIDAAHRQTGVDLAPLSGEDLALTFHLGSATDYVFETEVAFDSIWIDLYRSCVPEFEIFNPDFLSALKTRLKPNGLVFIHLFRPANCFYRYGRSFDAFEQLLARHLASFGYRATVLDHYSSQTWVIGRASECAVTKRLADMDGPIGGLLQRWLPYTRSIAREIPVETSARVPVEQLSAEFTKPVPNELIEGMGFDFLSAEKEWESYLGNPLFLKNQHRRLASTAAGSVIIETLALWMTAPGLELPREGRRYLQAFARSRPDSKMSEFELRRPLLA